MLIFWIIIFVVSLVLLVKGADWFVESSEKIGLAIKISPFIIGMTIVAIGTSFPELFSSIAAVLKGATEIVGADIIGSNIFNILIIIGFSAIVALRLLVRRSLIDLDAPLLATSTVLLLFTSFDGKINFWEGIILLAGFLVYFIYTIVQRKGSEEETGEVTEVLPSRVERREAEAGLIKEKKVITTAKLNFKVFLFLILGLICLIGGANYTIDSIIKISEILNISPALISIIALAGGTSLPELTVSVRAAAKKKYEIAIGNIFGSNVFNGTLILGISALIKPLIIDHLTLTIGLPFLIVSTLIFVISGISRRIHIWEGLMYVLIYLLFVAKLCQLF
jgi:cation:H+ antiporter